MDRCFGYCDRKWQLQSLIFPKFSITGAIMKNFHRSTRYADVTNLKKKLENVWGEFTMGTEQYTMHIDCFQQKSILYWTVEVETHSIEEGRILVASWSIYFNGRAQRKTLQSHKIASLAKRSYDYSDTVWKFRIWSCKCNVYFNTWIRIIIQL